MTTCIHCQQPVHPVPVGGQVVAWANAQSGAWCQDSPATDPLEQRHEVEDR